MIQEFIELWRKPADELLSHADSTISSHFSELCNQHFKHYKTLRNLVMCVIHLFYNGTFRHLIHFLNSAKLNGHRLTCSKLAKDRVGFVIDMEHEATFTVNHLYHLSYRHNLEAFYRANRWSYRRAEDPALSCCYDTAGETHAEKLCRLTDGLISGHPTDIPDLLKLIPGDRGDNAIGIIADVRAYWQGKFNT